MDPAGQLSLRGSTFLGRDVELIRPEVVGAFSRKRDFQHLEHSGIEAFARREVFDHEL
jgi:hypothetical protein